MALSSAICVGGDGVSLIKNQRGAKLDLLDEQALDVVLVDTPRLAGRDRR